MDEVEGKGGEQGAELAQQAKEAFDNHRYESCLSTLNKLMELRRHDKRVAHNRSVARYLLSNLTLTDEFRKNLQTLKAQVRKGRLLAQFCINTPRLSVRSRGGGQRNGTECQRQSRVALQPGTHSHEGRPHYLLQETTSPPSFPLSFSSTRTLRP